jgi:hypothetical protein
VAGVAGVGVALLLVAASARADLTKEQCVAANTQGQVLRLDGKLAAARARLVACMEQSCPDIVRSDCAQRLNELEGLQPTIAFEVKDGAGGDVSGVTVAVDGAPAERLGGVEQRLDPGEHVVVFAASGRPSVTRHIVLTEGEKHRVERVVLEAPAPAPVERAAPSLATQPDAPEAPPPGEASPPMSTTKILGLATGGVGAAGIIVGGVFGILTFSLVGRQSTECASATSCSDRSKALSDHASAATDATISTVGIIAGGALLATGAVLYLTSPRRSNTVGLRVVPGVGAGGGTLSLHGDF